MVRLWELMGQMLGHKWSSQFGNALTPAGELTDTATNWGRLLADLSGEEIANGLRKVATMRSDWWPTLNGFRELCRAPIPTTLNQGMYREYRRSRLLESDADKTRRRETGERGIASLKAAFYGRAA